MNLAKPKSGAPGLGFANPQDKREFGFGFELCSETFSLYCLAFCFEFE